MKGIILIRLDLNLFTIHNCINILEANSSIKTKFRYRNIAAYFTQLSTIFYDISVHEYIPSNGYFLWLEIFAVYTLKGINLYSAFPVSAI